MIELKQVINDNYENILNCKTKVELQKILFKITQDIYGVKLTTDVKEEVKEQFSIDNVKEISRNFSSSKEKIELIKFLNINNITYKDIKEMFEPYELFEVVKDLNIKVSKDNLQDLSNFSDNNDFFKILEQNSSAKEEKTITQIVLENETGNSLIDTIKNNNLRLDNEQLHSLITKNEDLCTTVNFKIIDKKYIDLEQFLPIITCHSDIQHKILSLNDNQYKAFSICVNNYAEKTSDWTPIADAILKNISQYDTLVNNIEEFDVDLLTKVLSEPNEFDINSLDEYYTKRYEMCNRILNSNDSSVEEIKFAILESKYGLNLEQAEVLIRKFGDDIETLDITTDEAMRYKDMIIDIKQILLEKNPEKSFDNSIAENPIWLERRLKDIYDREYVKHLYKPNEQDRISGEIVNELLGLEIDSEIPVFLAGKSTDGKFLMETSSPGAVYENENLKSGDFYADWNRPKMQSKFFCTITSSNECLLAVNTPFVEYGFSNFAEGSLRAAGYEDISSNSLGFSTFADEDEKYCDGKTKIDKMGTINENDRARGKQPDYIRFRKTRFMKPEKAKQMWEYSKKAANQWGIPIVIVDQDECTKKENSELLKLLQEFEQIENADLIRKVITRFENNRIGNYWGKNENNDLYFNTDFNIGNENPKIISNNIKSITINRNDLLYTILNTIRNCDDKDKKLNLFKELNNVIADEVSKVKIPNGKVLNDEGIPVVDKIPLNDEDREIYYFVAQRNHNTGEFEYLSSYSIFLKLRKELEQIKSTQDLGKETLIEQNDTKEKLNVAQDMEKQLKVLESEQEI